VRQENFRQLERKEQLKRDLEQISKEASSYRAYAEEFGANEEGEGILNDSESPYTETQLGDRKRARKRNHAGTELFKGYPKSMHHETTNIQRNPTPLSVLRQAKITKHKGYLKLATCPEDRNSLQQIARPSHPKPRYPLVSLYLEIASERKRTRIGVLDERRS
jgi:hypothetical protein